jgi:serine/threonine-protein kinase HipA
MREAKVFQMGVFAGVLCELEDGSYEFRYSPEYEGRPVSLTMPLQLRAYHYKAFPPFFEGLLPEGPQLEGLLRKAKLDADDFFGQLIQVGGDMVGSVTVEPA